MSTPASGETAAPDRAPAYAWYVVFVLILTYTVSYVDRTMLTLLVKPIRETLKISDLQISLLHGLAFAIFYTVLGLPLARIADRGSRRGLIMWGLGLWSLMTALCGFARSFTGLLLARIGVGVGEATLSPSAYSMLSDYFPPNQLTRALSVYTSAIYIGAGLALMGGGAAIALARPLDLPLFGHFEPWQVVFLIIGVPPGLVVMALLATVREPTRRGLSKVYGEAPSLGQVAGYAWARRGAYGWLIAGFSASSLVWNGVQSWIPTFFIRTFGWTAAQTGLRYGAVLIVLGGAGILTGSLLGGRLRARGHADSNLRVGVASALLMLPFAAMAPLSPTPQIALAAYAGFVFFGSFPYGAAAAAIQELTPNQMRAQMSAIYFLGLNLAGIGLGPMVVAALTDKVFGDDGAVRYALAITPLVFAPLSALLLGLGLRAYRRALAARDF